MTEVKARNKAKDFKIKWCRSEWLLSFLIRLYL